MTTTRVLALTAAVVALAAPGAAFAAKDPPGSEWTPLDDMPTSEVNISNTNEIGLERTPDGVLHVLWVNRRDAGTEALLHTPFTGTEPNHPGSAGQPPTTILAVSPAANQSFNENVDLIESTNGIRALFSATYPNNPIDSILATSTSADGTTWSNPLPASATGTGQRSPVYAASGIGGALGLDGSTYSTWGDSSPSGGGYHVGLNTSTPDVPFTPACCEIDPNVGVDSVTGEVVIAANLLDSGIQLRSLNSGSTSTVPKSASAWTQQRTSISGRIGAPGIYVAYGTGNNMFDTRPALWQVGAPKFKFLKNQQDAAHVGLAPAPQGRLWVYWDRNGKIYASRTNRAATKFGAIVKVPGALGSETFYRLVGEGSLGTLDLFALTDVEGTLNWWGERLAPGLTLQADNTVKAGQALKLEATDAGEPVKGIEIYAVIGGKKTTDTSNAQGKAKLKIPADANLGKQTAYTDFDPAYTGAKTTFKIKPG